jgi:hypothetical protein
LQPENSESLLGSGAQPLNVRSVRSAEPPDNTGEEQEVFPYWPQNLSRFGWARMNEQEILELTGEFSVNIRRKHCLIPKQIPKGVVS